MLSQYPESLQLAALCLEEKVAAKAMLSRRLGLGYLQGASEESDGYLAIVQPQSQVQS